MKQKELQNYFERLVKKHESTIYSVCYMYADSKEETDDLFQEVRVSINDLSSSNLLEFRQKLIKQKRQRFWQCAIAIPPALIWGLWFLHDFLQWLSNDDVLPHRAVVFGIIFGLLFLLTTTAICACLYRKLQKTNDEMISQLKELQSIS